MDWFLHKTTTRFLLSPSQNPYISFTPPPPSAESHGFSLNNTVSPSVFIIVVIFSVIFFLSGLAHLLIRLLWRPTNLSSTEMENLTALQGQLQQLFHLHDSGVDQSYIDTLPVFIYKEIIGVNSPFDCAVCLSEFENEDELRLLPKCSHAFHVICIDTWLMSHSTCPLCRASLVPDFPSVLMALESESGSSSSSETVPDSLNPRSHDVVVVDDDDFGLSCPNPIRTPGESWEKLVYIKLGKYRNGDGGGGVEGSSSDNGGEARRCFSMGSFAYVMDEKSCLKVPINASFKKKPHHGLESFRNRDETQLGSDTSKYISSRNGRESFSASKIWLVGKKDVCSAASMESTRRACSFRYPLHRSAVAAVGLRADNDGVFDNEIIRSCKSWDFEANVPRRPLQWLMGRQNKVVHDSSFSSNV